MSEWFENGILRVLVPSGWKLFYGIDSEGKASPRNLHIFKGAQTELDVFSKAGITVFYHGKDEIYISIKDFYENEELIAITKELTEKLRKNRTIDWQKRDSARAKMRMMIRKLLKDHRYPPEGMDDAVTTVMSQCELWADNIMSV